MTREIQFRGLFKDIWVYGSLVINKAFHSSNDEYIIFCQEASYTVLPETVGQFIGVFNEERVYEDDIIMGKEMGYEMLGAPNGITRIGRVIISQGITYYSVDGKNPHQELIYLHNLKVIGNTHNNPDIQFK